MSLICSHYNDHIENLDMKILYASFCGFNIFRGFRSTGVKIFVFRLTLLVIVTTVLPQVIAKIKKNCSKLTKRLCM